MKVSERKVEDIWEENWGYLFKKLSKKINFVKKWTDDFEKNEKMKSHEKCKQFFWHIFEILEKVLEINIIMSRKFNYFKNDAELDGQWWNLIDKIMKKWKKSREV